jgi:hypothetical protein
VHVQRAGEPGKTHRAAEVVVVGEGQCPVAEFFGTQQQFLHQRGRYRELLGSIDKINLLILKSFP